MQDFSGETLGTLGDKRFGRRGHAGRRAVLNWLQVQFGIEKPTLKLQYVASLDAVSLAVEVAKACGKKKPLSAAQSKALQEEHARSVVPLQVLAAEAGNWNGASPTR